MKIMKFGGTSIGNAGLIRNVIEIVGDLISKNSQVVIILSAFKGMTNRLIRISLLASRGNQAYRSQYKDLENFHFDIARDLISPGRQSRIFPNLIHSFNELQDVLHGIFLVKEISPRTLDLVMSFGERLSAYVFHQSLLDRGIHCDYLDSRTVVKTDNQFGAARVNFRKTEINIQNYFQSHRHPQIVTGFIGSTDFEETTTLGRGGSDFSASIFGAVLNAEVIEIWTDVDGFMTADPRKVSSAFTIPQLSYEEAMELSHFGAGVLHPATMQPALEKKIAIKIMNTFQPEAPGTTISDVTGSENGLIKGISSIDDIALIRIQGSGMVGVAGIAQRIFGAMAKESINVILITQASSEHSVCFAISPDQAKLARDVLKQEFRHEMHDKMISDIILEKNLSIVAIVGENMRRTPGVSGQVFQALGKNGINVVAIAQGSSELNISIVVSRPEEATALNVLHHAFFNSKQKKINIYLLGPGNVGGTLLSLIQQQKDYLNKEYSLNLQLTGVADSRHMLFRSSGIGLDDCQTRLKQSGNQTRLDKFFKYILDNRAEHSILVDCTANDEVAESYGKLLESKISIVSANKKPLAGKLKDYQKIRQIIKSNNVQFQYETNVGAGLPVINTLRSLLDGGDKIIKLEGILSGTLNYIFNTLGEDKKFSTVVREAYDKGYTEPDPREDLTGTDVARKILILCREIGMDLEISDITIENILPETAFNTSSVTEFLQSLSEFDPVMDKKYKQAAAEGKVMRYMAMFHDDEVSVRLTAVDQNHPFYRLAGTDNMVSITSAHYQKQPLTISGPGAGVQVTASGILADVLKIARSFN